MTEFLYADAHITGDFPSPSNAIGDDGYTWAGGDGGDTTNHISRWSIESPSGPLTTGTSTVRFRIRKTSQNTNPDAGFELWVNGSSVSSLGSVEVSSTAGVTQSYTFNNSLITDLDAVSFQVSSTTGGGGPSNRAHVNLAYIEWEVEIAEAGEEISASFEISETTSVTLDYAKVEFGTASLSGTAQLIANVLGTAVGAGLEAFGSLSVSGIRKTFGPAQLSSFANIDVAGEAENISGTEWDSEYVFWDGLPVWWEGYPQKIYLVGKAFLDSSGQVTYFVSVELAGNAQVDAEYSITTGSSANLQATASIDAQSKVVASGEANLQGEATLSADGAVASSESLQLSGVATLSASAKVDSFAAAALEASAQLVSEAFAQSFGLAEFEAVAQVSAEAIASSFGSASLFAEARMDIADQGTAIGRANLSATATLLGIAQVTTTSSASLHAVAMLGVDAFSRDPGSIEVGVALKRDILVLGASNLARDIQTPFVSSRILLALSSGYFADVARALELDAEASRQNGDVEASSTRTDIQDAHVSERILLSARR